MVYDKKDPKLISGTQLANKIKAETKEMIQELKEKHGLVPKLATVFPLSRLFILPTFVCPLFFLLLLCCFSSANFFFFFAEK